MPKTDITTGTEFSLTAVAPDDGIFTLKVDPETTAATTWPGQADGATPGPRNRPTAKQKAKTRDRRKAAKASRRRNR